MKNNTVINIARKWYAKFDFPNEYEEKFEQLLEKHKDLTGMPFAHYDVAENAGNHGKNLVMFLYFCEELSERYKEQGIPQEILLESLDDMVISVRRNMILRGELGIINPLWFNNHFSFRLFRLGRLQFAMTESAHDIPEKGIKVGTPLLGVHIPAGESMTAELVNASFAEAERFFTKYFPDFQYEHYNCNSWMLDDGLKQFLKENSNILYFQGLFETFYWREHDSILNFLFKYGLSSREEIIDCPANTEFTKKVKEYALAGGKFYVVLGIRDRKEVHDAGRDDEIAL